MFKLSSRQKMLMATLVAVKVVAIVGVVYAESWWSAWWPGRGASVQTAQAATGATQAATGAVSAPAGAAVAQSTQTRQEALQIQVDDKVLGSPMAPVTIIEYASMTCSHCADFKEKTLPQVKKEWVETGKANYVLRDLPWDNMALGMAKVARCVPSSQFYPLAEAFFAKQKQIVTSPDPMSEIKATAALAGLTPAQVEACITDENLHKQVLASKETARTVLAIKGTPTFFINGAELDGAVNYSQINKALESAYAAKTGTAAR